MTTPSAAIAAEPATPDLIVSYGDCEFFGRCECGVELGQPIKPDQGLDVLVRRWEAHVMGGQCPPAWTAADMLQGEATGVEIFELPTVAQLAEHLWSTAHDLPGAPLQHASKSVRTLWRHRAEALDAYLRAYHR